MGLERDLLRNNLEEIVAAPVESREHGRGDPVRWSRDTLYPQKLALTLLSSSGSSVDIVRSQTKTTEFSLVHMLRMSWPFH
jgi:hypothetical protein